MADAVSEGVGLLDEVGQASTTNVAGEMLELKSRLDRLESRLDGEQTSDEG